MTKRRATPKRRHKSRSAAFVSSWILALALPLLAEDARSVTPGEIHSMPRDQAALGLPVTVRGVVTYAYPEKVGEFVIEDPSGGLYISTRNSPEIEKLPPIASLVEITGVTDAGGFAPLVKAHSIIILGDAELPIARPATVNQLLTGRFDSRRVEISGVVRHVSQPHWKESLAMELEGEFGRVAIFVLEATGITPAELIDAEVIVRGVCFPFFNERAQVAGVRLEMNHSQEIEITRPPTAEPFSTPLVRLDRLQPFSQEGKNFHRQRIRGTVTLVNPGKYLYLQDGNHAVRVNLAERSNVKVGDQIDAVGFSGVRTRFVEWQQALIQKIGETPVPPAVAISPKLVLFPSGQVQERAGNDWDGRLISLTGRLEKVELLKSGARQLFMDCDGHVVTALLELPTEGRGIDALRPGSRISTTGICVVGYSDIWPSSNYVEPTSMSLLLRRSDDVTVIQAPPWWTPRRLSIALSATGLTALVGMLGVASLRRQVKRQVTIIARELETNAVATERERMARDLHDTLEQQLTGVAMQLESLAKSPQSLTPVFADRLALAGRMIKHSREEARRSVWDLRNQVLENHGLPAALQSLATSAAIDGGPFVETRIEASPANLLPTDAYQLLRMAQEALANSLKHAQATTIVITLNMAADLCIVSVNDDGIGFDPLLAGPPGPPHFGLIGMRERALKIGATLNIVSHPSNGCTVTISLPIPL